MPPYLLLALYVCVSQQSDVAHYVCIAGYFIQVDRENTISRLFESAGTKERKSLVPNSYKSSSKVAILLDPLRIHSTRDWYREAHSVLQCAAAAEAHKHTTPTYKRAQHIGKRALHICKRALQHF